MIDVVRCHDTCTSYKYIIEIKKSWMTIVDEATLSGKVIRYDRWNCCASSREVGRLFQLFILKVKAYEWG